MSDRDHWLHGADDVRSAASSMRSAADTMSSAASTMSDAVHRLSALHNEQQIFWLNWLERFEYAAAKMQPPEVTGPDNIGTMDFEARG